MSYLWWLFGLEEEQEDELKNKQKHLKFLCCKNIDSGNIPILRGRLSLFLNETNKKRSKKIKNKKSG